MVHLVVPVVWVIKENTAVGAAVVNELIKLRLRGGCLPGGVGVVKPGFKGFDAFTEGGLHGRVAQ